MSLTSRLRLMVALAALAAPLAEAGPALAKKAVPGAKAKGAAAKVPAAKAGAAKAGAAKAGAAKGPKKAELPADLQKRARTRMKSLDYEAAVPLLEKLKVHPEAEPRMRAEAFIDLGICHVNLGNMADARSSFLGALDLDAAIEPPPSSPPKVQKLFAAAHDERFPPAPPPTPIPETPPVVVVEKPVPPPAPPPPVVTFVPAPVPEVVAPPPPPSRGGGSLILPLGLCAVAAGGVAVGIFGGLQSTSAASTLVGGLHPTAEVEALQSRQATMSTISIIGYVGAGVATAGAVTAFFLTRGGSTPDVGVSLVVAPDGAMANASFQF